MAKKDKVDKVGGPKGLSLHLGLNLVSADASEGWTGPLAAGEADARDMAALADTRGLTTTQRLTPVAIGIERGSAGLLHREGERCVCWCGPATHT